MDLREELFQPWPVRIYRDDSSFEWFIFIFETMQLLLGIILSLKLILCLLYVSWLPGTPFKFGKVLVFSYMEHNKI